MIQLRDGSTTQDRRLDRLKHQDERSRNFRAVTADDKPPLRSYTWNFKKHPTWNDQGREGACVGFAWSHELACRPAEILADAAVATAIYKRAQVLDIWPGENYSGTSVLAGAQATQEILNASGGSVMPEYRWCFGIEDVLRALGRGPIVLGIDWLEGMFDTDELGFIRAEGSLAGGHAILARGVRIKLRSGMVERTMDNLDPEASYVLLRNSWGRDWGVDGDCKITVANLDRLLQDGGDACQPVVRSK